jgi:flagellin-like protein
MHNNGLTPDTAGVQAGSTMFDTQTRGQVGIGTLIVFIAMVLVAGISAGVLVNSAGQLQAQAQQTGEESTAEVSDTIQLTTIVGNGTTNDKINEINITTRLAAGSDSVNLSKVLFTIEADGETDVINSENFNITEERGDLVNGKTLTEQGDVASINIKFKDTNIDNLEPNGAILIRAQSPSGSKSEVRGQAPTDITSSQILD